MDLELRCRPSYTARNRKHWLQVFHCVGRPEFCMVLGGLLYVVRLQNTCHSTPYLSLLSTVFYPETARKTLEELDFIFMKPEDRPMTSERATLDQKMELTALTEVVEKLDKTESV